MLVDQYSVRRQGLETLAVMGRFGGGGTDRL